MQNFPPFTIRCFTGQPVPFDFTDGRLRATVSDTQYSVTLDVPNRQVWLHTPIERVPFAIYPAQEAQAWRLLKALAHAEEIGARLVVFPTKPLYYAEKSRNSRLGRGFPLRAPRWPEARTCAYLYPTREARDVCAHEQN